MVFKRVLPSPVSDRTIKRELETLYMRRSAVESLIRSLEEYSVAKPTGEELRKRKVA